MTFLRLLRLSGSVLLCLGWPALVGGLTLGGGGMVFYAWFMLVWSGWWVYGPVLGVHRGALACLRRPTLGHSLGAGALPAVLVPGALMLNEYNRHFPTPTIPAFSTHRTLDLVNYAVAGVLYGWLYWRWVRRSSTPPEAVGNEQEQAATPKGE
jgi:hypothetical protein